ncbi:MAG TPA: hypothetical protein VMT20_27980 [Terriglobia bacterium]|nr:hypothetical protein [Terriglobia bacterium]
MRHAEPPSPVQHRVVDERGLLRSGWVIGALGFVALSGVALWLMPFSVGAQMTLLLHTLAGLVLIIPFTRWQFSHWLATRKSPRTLRKVCAYTGFWLLAASCVTGVVVTFQALFALRVQSVWDRLHLWSGILALPFLAYHLYPAASPNRVNGSWLAHRADVIRDRRRMWIKAAGVGLALTLLLIVAALAHQRPGYTSYQPPIAYQSASGGGPFAPSFAATSTGKPVSPEILANSASCGSSGCHSIIYEEWLASAHYWSAQDEFFQAVRSATTDVQGLEVTEKCGACHDPVSLLAGYKDPRLGRSAPGYHHGDSCLICHAVRRVDTRGVGSYEIGVPKPYLYEYSSNPYAAGVAHFLIRAYPKQHNSDYDLRLVRLAESCAPCHKEWDVIDKSVGPVQVETQYDDWRQHKWNTDPDVSHRLRCQQCHMYYVNVSNTSAADPYDFKIGLGLKYRNHYFAAGNQFMPQELDSPDASGQVQRVNEWLHGERAVPEISAVWPRGPIVALDVQAPPLVRRGDSSHDPSSVGQQESGSQLPHRPTQYRPGVDRTKGSR